jgi:amidohydrolase
MGVLSFDSLNIDISPDVAGLAEDLVGLRRDFHRHPELGFEETRTQERVLGGLAACGIDARSVAGTGVLGIIRGKRPGKVLLLRADMDALPVHELSEIPWKSENPGLMHACGHDAHTAMLLGAAKIIQQRGLDKGAVKLMFQPAEEGAGGALRMVEEGILDHPPVDGALGFHVWSGYPAGTVMVRSGPVAASVDGFKLLVRGKGSHGAAPEEGVDPVVIAAQIITSAQALVTRRVGPKHRTVLSFTAINGGNAFNVIPETVEILGTFRTFDNGVRSRLRQDLETLSSAIATSFEGSVEYHSLTENEPVTNDPEMAALVGKVAREIVGDGGVIAPEPLMVGEDFSEVSCRVRSAFAWLGAGFPAPAVNYPHHHPRFTIDERVLPIGVEIAVRAALSYLG